MVIRAMRRLTAAVGFACVLAGAGVAVAAQAPTAPAPAAAEAAKPAPAPVFTYQEVMVPVRDGVRLQTVILTPVGFKGPLPIIFQRTPYGVPAGAPPSVSAADADLYKDGYIRVFQNLRGRFKSEGVFQISTKVDLKDPKAINEATDAYDSIDWLVKHVPNNNGRVGMTGVSYSGLTAGMALLMPHPALKAVSDQAAPADLWMNDDFHRYGALRLSYAFEYAVLEQSEKGANAPFKFDIYDTYDWYLKLGSVANAQSKLAAPLQAWTDIVQHPNYDAYWKEQAWAEQIKGGRVPTLTVGGFWDQEDPWGPWQIYKHGEVGDHDNTNLMVAGPWTHGGWKRGDSSHIGQAPLGGHDTGAEFRADVEAPFFRYWLHGVGDKPAYGARMFETGSNSWKIYDSWPPKQAKATDLYFHSDGSLSFTAPTADDARAPYREYVSDPANPVPYRPRPIASTFTSADWSTWETLDQRFVDRRPDVLTYVSAPLDHDITIAGEVSATLFASTSGTDSDMVVKLIDVYPENADPVASELGGGEHPDAKSMNGYQLPIAMEIRRGRFLESYEHPTALKPNVPVTWTVPLRDRDHVFLKGHRIMVQVQSSWFPVIDRNPQTFTPSIYTAKDSDFVKATQHVYATPAMPSHVTLPLLP